LVGCRYKLFDRIGRRYVVAAFLQDTRDTPFAASHFERLTPVVSYEGEQRLPVFAESVAVRGARRGYPFGSKFRPMLAV
jgi:hypothetical protein